MNADDLKWASTNLHLQRLHDELHTALRQTTRGRLLLAGRALWRMIRAPFTRPTPTSPLTDSTTPTPRAPRGVDIELTDTTAGHRTNGVIIPNRIRINGREVYTPRTPITVHELSPGEPLTVTLTLYVSNLTIKGED
ncbi:hypothetical protein ACFV0R_19015 [Streptomyces sp. NPDC059578]|uniref:hypothetical protein n=1 Tax=Streptomyces sp. NPDC059578 TaxID=3346874 RepID=UPI0036B42A72